MMTPYEIGVLLHYHTRPYDHDDVRHEPPIWRPTVQRLIGLDLLARSEGGQRAYDLTERGSFYVAQGLCQVPLPVRGEWRIPSGDEAADGMRLALARSEQVEREYAEAFRASRGAKG